MQLGIKYWQVLMCSQAGPRYGSLLRNSRGEAAPDLLRAVRETHPHLPAIFSSGFIPEEAEKEEPMDWVLYLPKPYRLPQLFEIVRSALELDPIRDVSGEPTLRLDEELSTSRRRRDPEATTSRVPVFRAGQALDSRATLVGNAPVVPEDSEES